MRVTDAKVGAPMATTAQACVAQPKMRIEAIISRSWLKQVIAKAMLTLANSLACDKTADTSIVLKRRMLPQWRNQLALWDEAKAVRGL